MALATITVVELAAALRLGDSAEETAEASRLLRYATEAINRRAPDAPVVVSNEAAVRLCGYLFDQPTAGRGNVYANALRNSGADAMLLPWRVHRAGNVDPPEAQAPPADETPETDLTPGVPTITVYSAVGATPDPLAAEFLAGEASDTGRIATPNSGQAAYLKFATAVVGFGRVERMAGSGGLTDARVNFNPALGAADRIIDINGDQFFTYVENVKRRSIALGNVWILEAA